MADFFDRFSGAAGGLLAHTSDSGDTWGPTGATELSLNGAGSVSMTGTHSEPGIPFTNWAPPSADYAVKVVVGADWRANATSVAIGPTARCSGAYGSESYYFLEAYDAGSGFDVMAVKSLTAGGVYTAILAATNITSGRIQTGDEIELQVSGSGATVTLSALLNGVVIGTGQDTAGTRILTAGHPGIRITATTTGQDVLRTIWAGTIGGPGLTLTPSSATVVHGTTQAFSATGGLPNEVLNWTATGGSCSPSPGTSSTYTAPGSGSSATVTVTSGDLPKHFQTAAVTLINFSLGASPGTIAPNATTTVTFTGVGTHWTSSAPTFTPSGVSGVSAGSVTVVGDTSATVPITTGAATGTITWTDSTTSATCTQVVALQTAAQTAVDFGSGFVGALGSVGFTVYSFASGVLTTFQARTTTGIATQGSLVVASFNGSPGVTYYVDWDTGGGSPAHQWDLVTLPDKTGYSLAATGLDVVKGWGTWSARQTLQAIAAFLLGKRSGVPAAGSAGTVTYTDNANVAYGTITVDTAGDITSSGLTPPA